MDSDGFIEAKAEYKKKNAVCLHEDLLRLALFGIDAFDGNNAKYVLFIQIIDKVNLCIIPIILFALCLQMFIT
jgi:hypothetical protein